MRLSSLYAHLGELIEDGVDPDTILCLPCELTNELWEVDNCLSIEGAFREDPSPKKPAPLMKEGRVIVLTHVGSDLEFIEHSHAEHDLPVEAPEKTWPRGWGK